MRMYQTALQLLFASASRLTRYPHRAGRFLFFPAGPDDPELEAYVRAIEAMCATTDPTVGTLIAWRQARSDMKRTRRRGKVTLASANKLEGCRGGTLTRYVHLDCLGLWNPWKALSGQTFVL